MLLSRDDVVVVAVFVLVVLEDSENHRLERFVMEIDRAEEVLLWIHDDVNFVLRQKQDEQSQKKENQILRSIPDLKSREL